MSGDKLCSLDDNPKLAVGPFFKYFAAKSGTLNMHHNLSFYIKRVTFNQKHFFPLGITSKRPVFHQIKKKVD